VLLLLLLLLQDSMLGFDEHPNPSIALLRSVAATPNTTSLSHTTPSQTTLHIPQRKHTRPNPQH
jgi:hypothetical protein